MSGLWITKLEYGLLEDGYSIKDIGINRVIDKQINSGKYNI